MKLPDDYEFKCYVINRLMPFPNILKASGFDGYDYNGKCYCVFHANENTPAAKLFHDNDGDRMFCFSEHKMYYPVDMLKKRICTRVTIDTLAERLWNQLSEDAQRNLIDNKGVKTEIIPENWEQEKENLQLFKAGKIDFDAHKKILYRALGVEGK